MKQPTSPAARDPFDTLGLALAGAGVTAAAWLWDTRRRAEYAASLHHTLVELLLHALSAGDAATARHSRRVADLADAIFATFPMTAAQHATLRVGTLLHDMGKIDDRFFEIVHSRGRLSPEQRAEIKGHPSESAHILEPLEKFHPGIMSLVSSHHERWDGGGYPSGLAGEQIPLGGRIISVADVFDALSQPRGYKAGRPFEDVVDELRRSAGSMFDPGVVARLEHPGVLGRWREVYATGQEEERAAAQK